MDKTKAIRMTRRIVAMLIAAFLLAILPLAIIGIVRQAFQLLDQTISAGERYQQTLQWCHIAGIAAMFFLNLGFFIENEKRGDSGRSLQRRNTRQAWLNALLIVLVFLIMVGFQYAIAAGRLIEDYLTGAPRHTLYAFSPYGLFLIAGIVYWRFCMRAVPATNNAVRNRLWRKSDDKTKRAKKTRK